MKLIATDCSVEIIKKLYAQIAISEDGESTSHRADHKRANGMNQ